MTGTAIRRDHVYVLAIDLPGDEAAAFADALQAPGRLEALLHTPPLDPAQIEVIDLSVFGDFGLSVYLVEGMGVAEDQIAPVARTLDALKGHAVVMRARALGADPPLDAHLAPGAPLRLVAALAEARAEPPRHMAPAAAAQGALDATGAGATPPPPRRNPLTGLVVIFGVGLAVLLVLLFARFGG